jgi:DNA / pantothenate metabolism flavoprotein/Class II Aldolase and Adducin N-terminal domain
MIPPSAHVLAGGTHFHVRPHLALAATALGTTGRMIARLLEARGRPAALHLTAMAGGPADLDTNDDVAALVRRLVADPSTRLVFMPVALCDFTGAVLDGGSPTPSGKRAPRLRTDEGPRTLAIAPAPKIVGEVRRERKDIFLVAFKATAGATPDEQFAAGLRLLKTASCNLVLCNDLHTRTHLIVTPEQAGYHETRDRAEALEALVDMALLRSRGTFTRSTVVPGDPVPWSSDLVPSALRRVVDHCVARGAYKPFLGATVGHFAVRLDDGSFLTSRRKTDFNRLSEVGLVRVEARGDSEVLAHGSRPSVGGQSQRIVFAEHPGSDCIVHFHCPARPGSRVPLRSQRAYECGSHECGKNTSDGLVRSGDLWAVMLDRHGPNIVFSRRADPDRVIAFIEENFDLARTTAGYALPAEPARAQALPAPISLSLGAPDRA